MPTPARFTGFEYGLVAPVTNGGGLFSVVAGAPAIVTTPTRSGDYALQIVASAEQEHVGWNGFTANAFVGRFYFRFPTLPGFIDFAFALCTAGSYLVFTYDNITGKLQVRWAGGSSAESSATIVVDTWYRVDYRVIANTNPRTIEWKLNGVDGTTLSSAETASTMASLYLGTPSAQTVTVYFDDVYLSTTSGDYPIGAGASVGLRPNADGTHNNAANIMEDSAGND